MFIHMKYCGYVGGWGGEPHHKKTNKFFPVSFLLAFLCTVNTKMSTERASGNIFHFREEENKINVSHDICFANRIYMEILNNSCSGGGSDGSGSPMASVVFSDRNLISE